MNEEHIEAIVFSPTNDMTEFLDELQAETPRAAAVLGAAFLDEGLRKLIADFLIDEPNTVSLLLGDEKQSDRPLSTFSARIRAAYCLGLISKDEFDDLNLIRRIRNHFAHRLHGISFEDEIVVGWCSSLSISTKLVAAPPPLDKNTSYGRFLLTVFLLTFQIAVRAGQLGDQRRKVLTESLIASRSKTDLFKGTTSSKTAGP